MRCYRPGLDPLTCLVAGLCLLHGFLVLDGGVEAWPRFYAGLGLSWDGVSRGYGWQLLTYAGLHGNGLHLLLNVLMLWWVGHRVAEILGWRMWGEIVVFGVLVGGFCHVLTGWLYSRSGHAESHLIGISGACFALLLVLTTLSPQSRMWPIPVSGRSLGLGVMLAELFLWCADPGIGLPLFSGIGTMVGGVSGDFFRMSHACHFGGALLGWCYARRLLNSPPSLEDLQRERRMREGAG